jgi:hypothetical protein
MACYVIVNVTSIRVNAIDAAVDPQEIQLPHEVYIISPCVRKGSRRDLLSESNQDGNGVREYETVTESFSYIPFRTF